jgi:hypothetical protein
MDGRLKMGTDAEGSEPESRNPNLWKRENKRRIKMLTGVYQWLRSLAGYFLFLAVLEQLLPDKSYSRYIRLFAGMILILLVVQPLTDAAKINERLARFYEELEFRYDAGHLREDILGVEQQQYSRLMTQYEEAVAEEITRTAAEEGYTAVECRAELDRDPDSETFGSVISVRLLLRIAAPSHPPEHTVSYLQKRIASCYHLEEKYVEIQVTQRQG